MSRIGRAFAAVLLLTFSLALPAGPAAAATPALEPHLGRVTLAPGGGEKLTLLWLRVATDTEAAHHFAITVDYGDVAGFATVDLALAFSASAAAARAADATPVASSSDTSGPCENTGTAVTCAWDWYFPEADLVLPIAFVSARPTSDAADGDDGTVTVTAKLDDSTTGTSTSTIRVGTAVDLAAGASDEIGAAPGTTTPVTPPVSNAGAAAVDGAALVLAGPSSLLGATSYSNCRYGDDLIMCTFDTTIGAGESYTPSQPFTLTPPADSVPGSVGEFAAQWLTGAEYEDYVDIFPDDTDEYLGTPGTGEPLELTASTGTQSAPPQSDVNSQNDAATYTMTVSGSETPDLAAIGATHSAAVGSEIPIEVGMGNRGPGTLHPELYENNQMTAEVRLPANVTAIDIDTRCDEAGSDGLTYTCTLSRALAPGDQDVFGFSVQLVSRDGEAGTVEVADTLASTSTSTTTSTGASAGKVGVRAANAANNTARIVLTASGSGAGLPITGPHVAGIGATGIALIVIGLLLSVRRGRRPVGAHARGKWGRYGRRKGSAR